MHLLGSVDAPVAERPPLSKPAPCRCGHDKAAHEHYRRGSDCALCPCARYRAVRRWTRRR